MFKFIIRHSQWIITVFGFLVFGLTQTEWLRNSTLWQKADGALIDRRYLLRSQRPPDPNIKLVGLETSSFQLDALAPEEIAASPILQLMQQPWPWDRRIYAAILDKLMDAGAKVVMFDFVFASKTDGDDDFAKALQKYKDRVAIGELFNPEETANSQSVNELSIKVTPPNSRLLLSGTKSIVGLVNQWPDPDQVVRRVKYHTSLEREKLEQHDPNLNPNIAEVLQKMVNDGEVPEMQHIATLVGKKYTGQDLTPPDDNLHYIDFQGAAGTYEPLRVENMFVDELWTNPPFNSGMTFSNKIVIVGPIAEIFHDIHPTPFGEMPGPELQAQIIAALLRGSWMTGVAYLVNITLTLVMMWLALEICLRIKNALFKVIVLFAATAAFLIGCQIAFDHKLVLPMTQPLFCLVITGAFGIVFQYTIEQFERLRYRNILGRYVSENVAKAVLEDRRSFEESLRGRKQPVTILFSDIRGFTSMTETTDADKLVAQLNEYFSEMVGIVLKEDGTLQKFIGDAIMAAWGDTHSNGIQNDAQRAVRAALQMRPALARLNELWKNNPDRKKLAIGIGVNHGHVIVGNIGTEARTEFTVLGDGVNLAARLESATKQFHTDILIGEETEQLTREHFVFRKIDALAFKGKTKPVEVFALLSDISQPPPVWLAKYHEAIKLYRGRKFAEAANCFEAARKEIGAKDYFCEMYIERCEAYIEQPPPENWDGSYTLTEK